MTGRRPQARRSACFGACVVACAILLGACGVGVNASPKVVNPKDVPFGLLRPSTPTTAPTRSGQYVTIYLVGRVTTASSHSAGSQRLVAVSREIPAPVTAARVLTALAAGPTSEEASQGLESPISTASPLTLWHLGTTGVTVNVAGGFTKLAGQDQAMAVAQVVFTLTALGIESVGIRIDGKRAKVPTPKGTLSGGPLNRTDYATVAPI
jgi:spore germination protein GerM